MGTNNAVLKLDLSAAFEPKCRDAIENTKLDGSERTKIYEQCDWSFAYDVPTTEFPSARTRTQGVVIFDSLYVFGGRDSQLNVKSDFWKLSLTAVVPSWTGLSSGQMPLGRAEHAMGKWRDYIVLYGGKSSSGETLSDVWFFDPLSRKWSEIVALNLGPRLSGSCIGTDRDNVYVGCGLEDTHVWRFNVQDRLW